MHLLEFYCQFPVVPVVKSLPTQVKSLLLGVELDKSIQVFIST